MLRAADAAGADAVIFADASVDVYNGKCVRASAGSLFHLPVVAGARLPAATAALRAAGLRVLAADGRGSEHPRRSRDPGRADRARPPGCSATRPGGCPEDLLALADESVAVPIYGRAESLNLAAAAAVCLYASAQAQHSAGRLAAAPVKRPVSAHGPVPAKHYDCVALPANSGLVNPSHRVFTL